MKKFMKDVSGMAAIEYAILLAFVGLICVVLIGTIGQWISNVLKAVGKAMTAP